MPKFELFENYCEKEDKKLKYVADYLPSPKKCIRMVVLGATTAGKSVFIKNVIFNWYKKYFDAVYVWSDAEDEKRNYPIEAEKHDMTDRFLMYGSYDDDSLSQLYDEIKETNDADEKICNTLMVFEDNISDKNIQNKHKPNTIDALFCHGRHSRIHIIIASQLYMGLNRNCRSLNLNVLVVFHGTKEMDLVSISKEHTLPNKSPEETLQLIKENIPNEYDYIVFDYTKPASERLCKGTNFTPIQL